MGQPVRRFRQGGISYELTRVHEPGGRIDADRSYWSMLEIFSEPLGPGPFVAERTLTLGELRPRAGKLTFAAFAAGDRDTVVEWMRGSRASEPAPVRPQRVATSLT